MWANWPHNPCCLGEPQRFKAGDKIRRAPLKGKDASSAQSVEDLEAKVQLSKANGAIEQDTRPKVLICGECHKVPNSYPKDASGQLERDEHFIKELTK